MLTVCGSEAETDLPFAGLHQLLLPVRGRRMRCPGRQRAALRNAFGIGADLGQPDKTAISMAVLTLLSDVADTGPLLLVAADARWLDTGTCDVLAFLARRLEGEPIALLVAARGTLLPPRIHHRLPQHVVQPLAPADAERVLDLQPAPPTGSVRRRILAEAAGNPLALGELAKAVARDGTVRRGDLPLTELIERTFATHVTELIEATRHSLVTAAFADTGDLSLVHAVVNPCSDRAEVVARLRAATEIPHSDPSLLDTLGMPAHRRANSRQGTDAGRSGWPRSPKAIRRPRTGTCGDCSTRPARRSTTTGPTTGSPTSLPRHDSTQRTM
ncbi:hypothetical protein H4W33_004187 [Kibdelosporangium phytohabitans]|uniref:Orc1-like AAA ATPase domain-containing protein n=1 Tax=Kibdelosporangium phytohabitans TaxID=860235 RepID=A0A0N9I5M5_9PSEU|nr:hypothetical protein [Kibdelosporangium phytohabitans]ALG13381.1 hypothetical protein AOZ06_46810 [Kibdelosporangium phytohabitans]MBE1465175.1 hypothetical protein [Kibdelosporangium phytohabitans]